MKKTGKIIKILIIVILLGTTFSFGQGTQQITSQEILDQIQGTLEDISGQIDKVPGGSLKDPIKDPGYYEPKANSKSDNMQLIERGNLVIGVIQFLGTAISVITLMTLGIRYMLASVQEKALYKETMGPYLIGAVMVFTIPNIIAILYDFITGNLNVI